VRRFATTRAAVLAVVAAAALGAAVYNATGHDSTRAAATTTITRSYADGTCDTKSICWICDGPVALDSVDVSVETSAAHIDAVHLASGCTGTIGSLTVTTASADGVKVAEGVHDLTIGGGSVTCTAKALTLHQDAVQAMGGSAVTFEGVRLDCGRADESLIDANWRVAKAGKSTTAPTGIVCDHCWLGSYTAHTVDLQESIASGVTNSTVCPGKFPRLTFTVGPDAVDPVNVGNGFPASC
jgi:hypothetical protein